MTLQTSFQIVGAFWYVLAIQRQDDCWRSACGVESVCHVGFLYCENLNHDGYGKWQDISQNTLQQKCTADDGGLFKYGIYAQALTSGVVEVDNFISKLCYCLWFGLQNLR